MLGLHADRELAVRLEASGMREAASFAIAARDAGHFPDAAVFRAGGGVAAWFARDSVLNGSLGLGMAGRVELEEVAALEAFYRERGSRPTIDVCPLCDPTLTRWIAERDFAPVSYENVLVRPCDGEDESLGVASGVDVRIGDEVDRDVWADVVANGFTEGQPTDEDLRIARASASRDRIVCALAVVDGVPAAGGMLDIDGGLGHLGADSTLPAFRGRGAQRALIAARLRHAVACGADMVYAETVPGSASQRNMERMGFRVAYTRVMFASREA